MEKQKKNDSGITLVALVVSVIVMLVLAGVSLNATVGENGIVTRAQEAALKQRVAEELENLNLELTKLNVDTIATDETMAVQDIANYLVGKGTIDSFVTTSAGQIAAGIDTSTGNKYFFGVKGDNTYRIMRRIDGLLSAELTTYSSGGDITGGYALVTSDSFSNDNSLPATEKGKFTITSDSEVVFMDEISGSLSIYVKSGVHASVGIYADMTLINQGISRSAIAIESGGTLDVYVGENTIVTVNSGLGVDADRATGASGKEGYAGINVPTGATLNVYGKGKLIAIGGNASAGADSLSGAGGSGGGGAGAGIGGNGGVGGQGGSTGYDGGKAEDCGNVNIYNSVSVEAYGGAGGSSGKIWNDNNAASGSGSGGGGYPAAGIGGGGAGGGGGNHMDGAGGYSGGCSEDAYQAQSVNGYSCEKPNVNTGHGAENATGGSYFSDAIIGSPNLAGKASGQYGSCSMNGAQPGSGGIAGNGGTIRISYAASQKLKAYNGNECTLSQYIKDENDVLNSDYYNKPVEIYAQNGVSHDVYFLNVSDRFATRKSLIENVLGCTINVLQYGTKDSDNNTVTSINYVITESMRAVDKRPVATSYGQGVGSGAGYIEVSNGTYTVYNEDSNGNFTTVYTGV